MTKFANVFCDGVNRRVDVFVDGLKKFVVFGKIGAFYIPMSAVNLKIHYHYVC